MKLATNRELKKWLTTLGCGLLTIYNVNAEGPSVSVSGYQTSPSGTNYACQNDTVNLTAGGWEREEPDAECCEDDEQGEWTYQDSTYSWSGDASGSSETATLNTDSAGSKSATCVATHTFECSVTGNTATREETASMEDPSSVEVKFHDENVPNITKPSAGTLGIDGSTYWASRLMKTEYTHLGTVYTYWKGTWSNYKGIEKVTENGNKIPRPCEDDWKENKSGPSGSVTLTASYSIATLSATYNTGSDGTYSSDVDGEEFKRLYGQWFNYEVKITKGDWDGEEYTVLHNNNGSQQRPSVENDGTYAVNGSYKKVGLSAQSNTVDCCPQSS